MPVNPCEFPPLAQKLKGKFLVPLDLQQLLPLDFAMAQGFQSLFVRLVCTNCNTSAQFTYFQLQQSCSAIIPAA